MLPRTAEEEENETARTAQFTRFNTWSHGVYKLRSPTEHLAVFHDDYNSSDTVVALVAMVIDEHYRRSAGGAPVV